MIKTIIFDIGNVLTLFAWEEFFEKCEYEPSIIDRLKKATVPTPNWAEYDLGLLTDEEILEGFIANDPGIEKELRESLASLEGIIIRCDYTIPWIKDLKAKGYQVLVLSNFSRRAFEDCAEALDFLQYTDGGILSYRDHLIKPNPAIYQLIIDRYHLTPSECVFIDDLATNVEGAKKAGMHSLVFHNQSQAIEDLKKLGVE